MPVHPRFIYKKAENTLIWKILNEKFPKATDTQIRNAMKNNPYDLKFQNAKGNLLSLMGATTVFGGKVKTFVQGIAKGVSFGIVQTALTHVLKNLWLRRTLPWARRHEYSNK